MPDAAALATLGLSDADAARLLAEVMLGDTWKLYTL